MKLPEELKTNLEEISNKYKQTELKNAYSNISERYMNQQRTGTTLLSSEIDVVSYANARMPATYTAVHSAIENSYKYIKDIEIKSLLDVGSGTGAATWAANEIFDFKEITCVEREENMLKFGKKLMQNTNLEKAEWTLKDITVGVLMEKADFVVSSYMLNEIKEEQKETVLKKLWQSTNKFLFIIEPGTPENYKSMMRYKKALIEQGATIIAPCPQGTECKLPEYDWCHFTCRIERTKIHKNLKDAESPFEDEKYIYLLASKEEISGTQNRVLRHPKISKGYVELKICTPNGIEEEKITKKDGEKYKKARKIGAGEEL